MTNAALGTMLKITSYVGLLTIREKTRGVTKGVAIGVPAPEGSVKDSDEVIESVVLGETIPLLRYEYDRAGLTVGAILVLTPTYTAKNKIHGNTVHINTSE